MAYSDFTLDTVRKSLGFTLARARLFATLAPVDVPQWLIALLEKGMPLAFVGRSNPGMERVDGRIHITVMRSPTRCTRPLPY